MVKLSTSWLCWGREGEGGIRNDTEDFVWKTQCYSLALGIYKVKRSSFGGMLLCFKFKTDLLFVLVSSALVYPVNSYSPQQALFGAASPPCNESEYPFSITLTRYKMVIFDIFMSVLLDCSIFFEEMDYLFRFLVLSTKHTIGVY